MAKIKNFLKTAVVFFIGNVLSKTVSFFLLPLYTAHLSPEQYGTYDIAISLINLIAPIAFIQIWDGMFRFSFDFSRREDKYRIVNQSVIVFLCGILVYLLVFAFINRFVNLDYFIYVLSYGFLYAVQYIYSFASRALLKNKLFVASGVLNTIITSLLNILLIVVFNWDIKALYVSHIVGITIQILFMECGLGVIRRFKFEKIDKNLVRKMVAFSVPLCVATISYWLLSGFTRVLISYSLGSFENGIFAVANHFSSIVSVVMTVFQYAWNETAYLMSGDGNRTKIYSVCIDLMLKCMSFGSVLVILVVKLIFPFFVADQYFEAIMIIPPTILGVALNSTASFLGTLFMTEKKTNYILVSTLVAASANVVIGIAFMNELGLLGMTTILSVSFLLLMLLRAFKLIHQYEIKFDLKNLLLIVVVVIGVWSFYCFNEIGIIITIALMVVGVFLSLRKYLLELLKCKKSK